MEDLRVLGLMHWILNQAFLQVLNLSHCLLKVGISDLHILHRIHQRWLLWELLLHLQQNGPHPVTRLTILEILWHLHPQLRQPVDAGGIEWHDLHLPFHIAFAGLWGGVLVRATDGRLRAPAQHIHREFLRASALCVFVEVQAHGPVKVLAVVLHVNQPPRLQKVQHVLRQRDHLAHFLTQLLQLHSDAEILRKHLLVLNMNLVLFHLQLRQLLLQLWLLLLHLELVEGPADQVLGVHLFNPQQVEDHVEPQMKRRVQNVRFARGHVLGHLGLHLLVNHQDGDPKGVQPTPPCPPTHLNVLAAGQPPVAVPVELPELGEDHGPCRHVQPHGEGLSGEQHLHQPFLEQDLDHFFEDGQQARVVDANATLEQRLDVLHLRQLPVLIGQRIHGVVENLHHELFFVLVVEVQLGQLQGQCLALLLGEGEDDTWGQ
mmetsp:Transcript_22966/g.39356  ORF Transcript_22966/g.39356 Transcript_22966/m.39356 type:complete len:431 (-) Transcript_22966:115-1407(-)